MRFPSAQYFIVRACSFLVIAVSNTCLPTIFVLFILSLVLLVDFVFSSYSATFYHCIILPRIDSLLLHCYLLLISFVELWCVFLQYVVCYSLIFSLLLCICGFSSYLVSIIIDFVLTAVILIEAIISLMPIFVSPYFAYSLILLIYLCQIYWLTPSRVTCHIELFFKLFLCYICFWLLHLMYCFLIFWLAAFHLWLILLLPLSVISIPVAVWQSRLLLLAAMLYSSTRQFHI